ncbi:hypothetical protein SAMN05216421_2093 [Halopseudomonas xinjiangensis]|uniref:Uncharacterized protein n=1 Tax=Halopseudomonas xinjiangensis TaxID=487184 RepID=A0A1H1UPR3_9GAMM|nr:hypothetical protein [Halopseudomonas xinjiangensis]SDS73829.1 hypothetical protein SAMN05216421_2093 [Halopseudomonas xinjiangensis]
MVAIFNETKKPVPEQDALGSPRDCLEFFRKEGQQALDVLFQKVAAFLAIQSCLTITYGLSMLNENPRWADTFTLITPAALGLFAMACCMHAWPSIRAASETVLHWQGKQLAIIGKLSPRDLARDRNPLLSRREERIEDQERAMLYAKLAPSGCATFWLVLTGTTLWIQL